MPPSRRQFLRTAAILTAAGGAALVSHADEVPPPPSDHAGCAFRGEAACSLDVADRPNLCVRFICRELESELSSRPEWSATRKLARELGETFTRFAKLREQP